VVLIVPAQFARQDAMLVHGALMPVLPTPIIESTHETAEPLPVGLALDRPASIPGFIPEMVEPQKHECPRPFAWLSKRPTELHHPAFLRMYVQSKPLESLWQNPKHFFRVSLLHKPYDEVIRVTYQKAVSSHAWAH